MKALTLTQPWATLVAIGAKTIETRSWRAVHRGELAIHAAKGVPGWAAELLDEEPFRTALTGQQMPRGCVVAIARLVDIVPTERWIDYAARLSPHSAEYAFGDYGPGRFMWILEDVRAIDPVPAKGAQGLWEWER